MAAADQTAAMKFIRSEQLLGRESIGWIPWQGVVRHANNGRLGILTRNADYVGFLLFGASSIRAKIVQIWVRPDARVIEHGRAMIGELAWWAAERCLTEISLWCAVDLEANLFWQALDFAACQTRVGSPRTGRRHQRWVISTNYAMQAHQPATAESTVAGASSKSQTCLWDAAEAHDKVQPWPPKAEHSSQADP
jgi:hypothetical protein